MVSPSCFVLLNSALELSSEQPKQARLVASYNANARANEQQRKPSAGSSQPSNSKRNLR